MIGFVIGMFVGCMIGVFIMALCITAKRANEDYEQLNNENE